MAKYQVLAEALRQKIIEGIISPGNKLPSEYELQKKFQVSRQTVRNALEVLEKQGFVRGRQGSGTYVLDREAEERKKSRRIAVVTTYVDNYIFPKIIQGIESVLAKEGFQVQIAFTGNHIWREEAVLKDLLEQDLRGIIIETTKSALPNPNLPLYRRLQEKGVPVLFINSRYPELDCPAVSLHDEAAGWRHSVFWNTDMKRSAAFSSWMTDRESAVTRALWRRCGTGESGPWKKIYFGLTRKMPWTLAAWRSAL